MSARPSQLVAIAAEEQRNVAAEAEEVHHVAEIRSVLESERVPELVDAREIDDRVAEQRVGARALGDRGAERIGVGPDEHGRAAPPVDFDRDHFAVLAAAGFDPEDVHERGLLVAGLEVQLAARRPLPVAECPGREVAVAVAVRGARARGCDEVSDAAAIEGAERGRVLRERVVRQRDRDERHERPRPPEDPSPPSLLRPSRPSNQWYRHRQTMPRRSPERNGRAGGRRDRGWSEPRFDRDEVLPRRAEQQRLRRAVRV